MQPAAAKELSLVLPCYNEEHNVEPTIRDSLQWFDDAGIDGEVIAVNDGSSDGTKETLERLAGHDPRVVVIHHPKNRGYGAAITTGCDAAAKEVIAFMDSDGQFRAEELALLLPHLQDAPFVTGRRLKRADPFIRIINAKLYGFLVWLVLGMWIRDINCGLKLFRKDLWPVIRPRYATGALFNAEIFYVMWQEKIRWAVVPVPHYPRQFGMQTGAKPSVIIRMFQELLALRRKRRKKQ